MPDPVSAILLALLLAAAGGAAGETGKTAAKRVFTLLDKLTNRAKKEKDVAIEHNDAAKNAKNEIDALQKTVIDLANQNTDLKREIQELKSKSTAQNPETKKHKKR